MSTPRDNLAVGIRQHRARLDLTQEELARQVDIHRNYVSRLERGEASCDVNLLWRLSEALGVEPTELMNFGADS